MGFSDQLAILKRLGKTIHIVVPEGGRGPDLPAVLRGLIAAMPARPRTMLFAGNHLRPEQGRAISEALCGGTTVLIGSTAAWQWADVLDAWDRYCDAPRNTSIQAAPHLRFAPIATGPVGTLIVVSPRGAPVPTRRAYVLPLDDDECGRLERAGGQRNDPLETIGYASTAAGEHSIRDLCLLHHRDPPGTPRRPLGEALNADGPFTWTDLQALLQWQPNSTLPLIDVLSATGRLEPAIEDSVEGLVDFLNSRRELQPRGLGLTVWPSIWDAVWYLAPVLGPGLIFRGHGDARWSLKPTLLRDSLEAGQLDLQTLLERVERTRAFVDLLREERDMYFSGSPTDDEMLAVAQHYGFPTPLLDFTRSLAVAALFASQPAAQLPPDTDQVGVIFYLDPDRRELGDAYQEEVLPGLSISEAAQVRIGAVRVLEPALSGLDDRITRQAGVFLAGFDARDLASVSIDRIYFRQVPGEVYEDDAVGVTREHILPPDSALQRLANEVRDGRRPSRAGPLSPALAATRIGGSRLVGTAGTHMFRQLNDASDYFTKLNDLLDDQSLQAASGILREYFQACMVRADIGETPSGQPSGPSPDPLRDAVHSIAGLCGVDAVELSRRVREELGELDDPYSRLPATDCRTLPQPEAVALSLGLYVASWEKLQVVRGMEASTLAHLALMVLTLNTG